MKGKQLFYDDLMKLPIGTKVYVKYDLNLWSLPVHSGIEKICEYDKYSRCTMDDSNLKLEILQNSILNTEYYEWIS